MLDSENDNVIHMSTRVQTTPPEATKTLEQAWKRRRAELANWQPSGGWLTEQRNVHYHSRTGDR